MKPDDTCRYCNSLLPRCQLAPDIRDNCAWAFLASYHTETCEWIRTRGFIREVEYLIKCEDVYRNFCLYCPNRKEKSNANCI